LESAIVDLQRRGEWRDHAFRFVIEVRRIAAGETSATHVVEKRGRAPWSEYADDAHIAVLQSHCPADAVLAAEQTVVEIG
jgi:hypothetical protein